MVRIIPIFLPGYWNDNIRSPSLFGYTINFFFTSIILSFGNNFFPFAYQNLLLFILTFSGSLGSKLLNLINDSDWGDPREYDLKITRTGDALETKYTVSPKPKKEIPSAAKYEFELMNIKLEKLITGEDPFEG